MAKKTIPSKQLDLFAEVPLEPDVPVVAEVIEPVPVQSIWNEVPQARFNSWPERMQLAYCIARDKDASIHCDTSEEAQWFLWRAAMYEETLRGL